MSIWPTAGVRIDAVVHDELQQQGTFTATIRNIITSLRMAAALDWSQVFETVSPVDAVLDRTGRFYEMDFTTRTLYRSAIEQLARHSPLSETEVANRAVALAADAAATHAPGDRRCDPGYYLLAGGTSLFETAIGFQPPLSRRVADAGRALGLVGYGAGFVTVAALFVAGPLWALAVMSVGVWWLLLLGLMGLVPASEAAIACVNRFSMWALGATSLPGLELSAGIPPALRTMVAVPALLTSLRAVDELVARLEIHHLASPDGEVQFALLSDWTDSPTEHAEDDEALLNAAVQGVEQLNARYRPDTSAPGPASDRFVLLHRRRLWNAGEASWMGWERKRGKLHELNRLLRGATDTSFLPHRPLPAGVRYVITLDSDTRLPRDTVRRLVGKMAHPLNAPVIDPELGRVVEGHAVLQPRVTPSLPMGPQSSLFQRVFSSMDGIDAYAGAISDVYQDLFGEGSFAGKGIYDIDAFETALAGRVPESTLLSHDLFEGVFARAGLASDIEVVEDFPAIYAVAVLRQHRWARGDWQLLPWIISMAPEVRRRCDRHREAAGDRTLEDARQPAAHAPGARNCPGPPGRLAAAARFGAGLDRVRAGDRRRAAVNPPDRRRDLTPRAGDAAQPSRLAQRRAAPCGDADGADRYIHGPPGGPDGRRCPADTGPPRLASPAAAMGHRGAGGGGTEPVGGRPLPQDGRGAANRASCRLPRGRRTALGLDAGGTVRRAVDRLSRDRLVGKPLVACGRRARRGGPASAPPDRPQHLALL